MYSHLVDDKVKLIPISHFETFKTIQTASTSMVIIELIKLANGRLLPSLFVFVKENI